MTSQTMQQGSDPEVTDLTRGVYRRIYAGYIKGRRINEVSLDAEAWFWRIHAVADDFGNADGDPRLLRMATAGYREVTTGQVAKWLDELVEAKLLVRYVSNCDTFIHIPGFIKAQPAGKNGKRIRRYPAATCEPLDNSRGFQVNPVPSSASDNDTDTHTDTENDTEGNTSAQPQAAEAAVAPADVAFPTFPTVGRGGKTWLLTEKHVAELQVMFPGVNVKAECLKAFGWIKADLARRKTAGGMPKFLYGWVARNQDRKYPGKGDAPVAILPTKQWKERPYTGG